MPTAAQQRRAAAAEADGSNMEPKVVEKQLGIQVRALERLAKEHAFYQKEVVQNETKLKDMKSNADADPYDIKKFEEVLGESHMMVPDSKRRLEKAVQDLKAYVEQTASSVLDVENEVLVKASGLLKDHGGEKENETSSDALGEGGATTIVEDLKEGEAF